jgi:hypothetical protein
MFTLMWLVVLCFIVFLSMDESPWRFSLRTLLVVMTLMAVTLGLVAYASNSH